LPVCLGQNTCTPTPRLFRSSAKGVTETASTMTPGDTPSQTGGPARLPAKISGRWTHIKIVYGEEKNICTGLIRAAKAG
jgi:hypothetical protein